MRVVGYRVLSFNVKMLQIQAQQTLCRHNPAQFVTSDANIVGPIHTIITLPSAHIFEVIKSYSGDYTQYTWRVVEVYDFSAIYIPDDN